MMLVNAEKIFWISAQCNLSSESQLRFGIYIYLYVVLIT